MKFFVGGFTMKFRYLLILVLLMVGLVSAQELDPCLGLDSDDCELISEASANGLSGAEAFTIDFELNFEAESIPLGGDTSDLAFGMEGRVDVLEGDGDLLPFNFYSEFDVTLVQGRVDNTVGVELMVFEDILYFTNSNVRQWQHVDLVEFFSDRDIAEQFEELGEQMSDVGEQMGELSAADLEPLMQVLTLPGFLAMERDGDDFVFTMDLTALQALNDEENEDLMEMFIEGLSAADPTVGFVLPRLLEEMEVGTIELVQSVNTDLNIVQGYQFKFEFVGPLEGLVQDPPTTEILFELNFEFDNFDDVDEFEAPENSEDMTEIFIDAYKDSAGL
jgi:hypothetical protein